MEVILTIIVSIKLNSTIIYYKWKLLLKFTNKNLKIIFDNNSCIINIHMIYFSKLIDICINRQEKKVVDNYDVHSKKLAF